MDWVTISCSLLAFLLYYNTLNAGFVYDDRRAIVTNPDVVSGTPLTNLLENDFWGTPLADGGTHGSYRPLCVATFRLNYEVAGLNPWSYHLLNVLLHCLSTALIIRVARQIFPPNYAKSGSAVTGLIFAAHPIHTEAVAGIVGRADLSACNLFLLSFLAYTSHMNVRDIYQTETLSSIGSISKKPNHIVPNRIVPRKNDYRLPNDSELNETPFYRLSCHGLIQQLFQCLRRLIKVGDIRGPVSLLTGSRSSIASSAKKLKCIKSGKTQKCGKKLNKWHGVLGSVGSDSVSGWREWGALSASVGLAVAATLCKETGLMALPVCIVYDLLKGIQDDKLKIKNRLRSICITGMALAATALTRLQLVGGVPAFAAADNPAARDPHALTRFFTFAYLPAFNFLMLVFPITLSFDWSMEAIPRINGLLDLRNFISAAFYVSFIYATWRASTLFVAKQLTVTLQYTSHHQKQRHHILRRNHRNHNSLYSKPPNRYVTSSSTNQREYNHARHRDKRLKKATANKKVICPNAECKHFLTEDHSQSCIQINNNNSITQQSTCTCVAAKIKPRFHRASKDYPKRKVVNKTSPQFAFLTALAFLTLPFVPASNIFFYVGFVVAERVLYLPSVGYCLLVGLGAARWLAGGGRAWRGGLLALLLLAFSARTLRRNLDWRDEESLFRSAVHVNPPKAYGNLGSVLSSQGRLGEAEMAYRRALAHRSNMADVHYNLGVLLHGERSYDAAIKSFEKAIQLRPSMALAYVNLGASLSAVSRPGAAAALRAAARADGARVRDRRAHAAARVSALVQLGALHSGAARWTQALAAYQEALDAMPPDGVGVGGWSRQSVYTFIGDSNYQLSRWPEAERAYRAAVAEAPDSAPAYLTYAKLLARNSSRAVEAEQWFTRALQLEPKDPNIRHYYGEFLQSQLRHREAAEQFVSAAELAAPDAARAAAAARALRDAARCELAERWYGRAAELRPEDPEYQSNFGAILHLNGKYVQAAAAYRRALRLQPDDEITLTNLRRVRSLMHRSGDPRIHL